MKKLIVMILTLVMVFQFTAFADTNSNEITVIIKGTEIEFDVPPQIINGRTMVPMRKIFETLGARVQWVAEAQLIVATKGSKIMSMSIGNNNLSIVDIMTEDPKNIPLDVPPLIVDSRTLVPARAVSEALNMEVSWDGETRTVTIEDKESLE